jgi:hypothetical protein
MKRSGHHRHRDVLESGMSRIRAPRHRPSLSLTLDPEVERRLRALADTIPGANLSQLVDELLLASLPLYEDMAQAFVQSMKAGGEVDEARAEELFSAAIGARILKATGMPIPIDVDAERDARLDARYTYRTTDELEAARAAAMKRERATRHKPPGHDTRRTSKKGGGAE